jgi:hypothetical protein
MKRILILAVILIFSVNVFAQNTQTGFDLTSYGVRIEPDKRLMVVLAALEAADVDTPLTGQGSKFRQKLRMDLVGLNDNLRQKLIIFVQQYKRRHPKATNSEIIAPFISMAYTLAPVPDLTEPRRSTDLPGDLLDVLDFAPLVREFYRATLQAEPENVAVRTKIDEYVKDYQAAGVDLRPSASEMVGELLDYLHTKPQLVYIDRIKTESKDAKGKKTLTKTETRERERRFYIVPELLAPRGTINFVNVGDSYHAIVPPQTDLSQSEVRRAYLQFVIDPLVLNNAKDIAAMRDGIKALLDEQRKQNAGISPDVFLAVTRSLVAAAEARQIEFEKTQIATVQARRKIDAMKTDAEKRAVSAELDAFKKSLADETLCSFPKPMKRRGFYRFISPTNSKAWKIQASTSPVRCAILSFRSTRQTKRLVMTQFADARKRATAAVKNAGKKHRTEFIVENR